MALFKNNQYFEPGVWQSGGAFVRYARRRFGYTVGGNVKYPLDDTGAGPASLAFTPGDTTPRVEPKPDVCDDDARIDAEAPVKKKKGKKAKKSFFDLGE